MKRLLRLLVLGLFLYGIWYVGSIAWDISGIFRDGDKDYEFVDGTGDMEQAPGVEVKTLSDSQFVADPLRINILLIGVDIRPGSNRAPLSDTIMLLSLHTETGDTVLISIPRDTYVKIPDRGYDKINHSHAFGGAALLRRVVSDFLDIPVDYYLRVDFQGFSAIVDMLGGVDIYVDRDMPEYNLWQGQQTLTGQQALMFVRNRNEPRGDFARMERQQRFLLQVMEQVQSQSFLEIVPLIQEGVQYVDTNMPLFTLLAVAREYWELEPETTTKYVISGRAFYHKNIYYLEPLYDAATKFLNNNLRVPREDE